MARLRLDDSNAYNDTQTDSTSPTPNATGVSPDPATRRSPRKKLVKSYRQCDGSETDEQLPPVTLVPKTASKATPRSKQVRLAPLGLGRNTRAPLQLDVSEQPIRRRRQFEAIKSAPECKESKTSSKSKELNAPVLAPPPSPRTHVTDENTEVDAEESIWCGSDAADDDSSEDLPTPGKFIKPGKRSLTAVAESGGADITLSLAALRISESPPIALPPPKPSSRFHTHSRPAMSSSDKENDNRAILRFSPPRLHSPRRQRTPERAVTPPPTSPSKGRLLSPSKRSPRVPAPPLRSSLDAFWNAETVNDWNDQYSPRKEWHSPSKPKRPTHDISSSPPPSPLSSPRKNPSPAKRTKAELEATKTWHEHKHRLATDFLTQLDQTIAQGRISILSHSTGGVRLLWSKTLTSTAGRANWKRETTRTRQPDGSTLVVHAHHASIELAEKVIGSDTARLRNVLAHEFCHLCTFMISGIKDQPHGRQFQEWGAKCTQAFGGEDADGVRVTTKHTYAIEYKYVWRCGGEECGAEFKRHSKSIDTTRHTCGSCRGALVQIKPVPRRRNAAGATGYAGFVKENFAKVKREMPGASQKLVMEAVARLYRAEKAEVGGMLKSSGEKQGQVDGLAVQEVEKLARVLEFVTISDDD